jgi:hypothetical protein
MLPFTTLCCATLRFREEAHNRGEDIRLTKPHRFVFKVSFELPPGLDAGTHDLPLNGHSVLAEVEPEEFVATTVPGGSSGEAARYFAEETARRAALETIQKDLPEGVEPVCLVLPVDRLPGELRRRAPTLHTCGARAWLV